MKKSRAHPKPTSYVDAVSAGRKMAIVPSNYPETVLKQEESDLLTRALLEALDAVPSGQALPCFDGHRWEQGAMGVTCSDDAAKAWLKAIVPTLKPWEDASLQVLERDGFPRLKKTSAVFFGTKEETEMLFRRLKRQNPALNTDIWRVWDRREVNGNVHFTLSVDAPSMERPRSMDGAWNNTHSQRIVFDASTRDFQEKKILAIVRSVDVRRLTKKKDLKKRKKNH